MPGRCEMSSNSGCHMLWIVKVVIYKSSCTITIHKHWSVARFLSRLALSQNSSAALPSQALSQAVSSHTECSLPPRFQFRRTCRLLLLCQESPRYFLKRTPCGASCTAALPCSRAPLSVLWNFQCLLCLFRFLRAV